MSRHRANRRPRFGMLPGYRPSHCAGVTPSGAGCLHEHADETRCKCGQVILSPTVQMVASAIQPFVVPDGRTTSGPVIAMRHASTFCHNISPGSQALQKAGA